MDDKSGKPVRVTNSQIRDLKRAPPLPPGVRRRRFKTMAQLEREAARRRWLMISAALVSALISGILIGRFLVP